MMSGGNTIGSDDPFGGCSITGSYPWGKEDTLATQVTGGGGHQGITLKVEYLFEFEAILKTTSEYFLVS